MARVMDEDAAELAALRRRAYGPQADIGGDPTAMARLGELEHRLSAAAHADPAVSAGASRAGAPTAPAANAGVQAAARDARAAPAAPDAGASAAATPAAGVAHPRTATGHPRLNQPWRDGEDSTNARRAVPSSRQHLIAERDAGAPGGAEPAAGSTGARRARVRPPAWHTAMVVAVAAVTVLVGGAAAAGTSPSARPEASASPAPPPDASPAVGFEFAADPSSRILFRVPLSGVRGQLLDLPDPDSGPDFPTEQAMAWTQPLGEYFGWRLWIARDRGDDPCMLVTAGRTFSRCVTADEQRDGALFLSVPYDLMTEAERPAGMAPDQSIGFWWIPGDTVLILTGRTADAAP